MIINHKYKFIFIHVPKCAGTSIKRALYPYGDKYDQFFGGHPDAPEGNDEVHKHSTALEVKRFATTERWEKYFTFSFVRNPFSRIVSLYNWWNEVEGIFDPEAKKAICDMSFKEFVFSEHSERSQLEFLTSKEHKETFVPNKNRIELDFIGKQETINKDFSYLCGLLKLPNLSLKKLNTTRNLGTQKSMDYYDEESEKHVRRKFNEDFDFFNY
jgi:hypothetical protein